jgi:hypothetical protein
MTMTREGMDRRDAGPTGKKDRRDAGPTDLLNFRPTDLLTYGPARRLSHRYRCTRELMNRKKKQKIEEALENIEERLANAREYIARNVNVVGVSWLHFDDWWGKSGHPSWMRNYMIPSMMKLRAKKEKALRNIDSKAKDKNLTMRKRYRASEI